VPADPKARVCAVAVPGSAQPWLDAGFDSDPSGFDAGEVSLILGAPESEGVRLIVEPASVLDGAGTMGPPRSSSAGQGSRHPNGVFGVDHVVVATPSMARTRAAMLEAGLDLRLERQGLRGERAIEQAFFLAGGCVLELVGTEDEPDGPAAVWGITFVTSTLDGLPALEGSPVASIRDAVQPGRRIAVARRDLGLPTRVAFMDPRTTSDRS
jgi:hypothetical protein